MKFIFRAVVISSFLPLFLLQYAFYITNILNIRFITHSLPSITQIRLSVTSSFFVFRILVLSRWTLLFFIEIRTLYNEKPHYNGYLHDQSPPNASAWALRQCLRNIRTHFHAVETRLFKHLKHAFYFQV